MRQAMTRVVRLNGRGIKIQVSGRLGGSEIARTEKDKTGKVPLHTLRADIDYGFAEAHTVYGIVGCKVWIYKGEVLPEKRLRELDAIMQTQQENRRKERDDRAPKKAFAATKAEDASAAEAAPAPVAAPVTEGEQA
jgi:small subunit ribosomal protein S3